jgi:hypothetical protein
MRKSDRRSRTPWRRACALACLAGGVAVRAAVVTNSVPVPPGTRSVKLPADESSAIVDGVAAYVNGDGVTISDVMAGVRSFLRDPKWTAGRSREAAFREAYAESLGQAINQRLIVQAYRAGDARLPDWLVEKRLGELLDTRFDGDRGKLMKELSEQRLTVEDWRERVEEQMIVAAMRQSQVDAHVQISPAQIRAHYEAHATNYAQKAATRVGLILLKARPDEDDAGIAARAAEVERRLRAGEAFDKVAAEVSEDPSAKDGGDWGWIVPGDVLRDELAAALADLPVGGHRVVPTSAGTYVLRKADERAGGQQSLDDARATIEKELFDAESRRLFLSWMMRLRSKAHVQTFDVFE